MREEDVGLLYALKQKIENQEEFVKEKLKVIYRAIKKIERREECLVEG
jgi:hypothetical protein